MKITSLIVSCINHSAYIFTHYDVFSAALKNPVKKILEFMLQKSFFFFENNDNNDSSG